METNANPGLINYWTDRNFAELHHILQVYFSKPSLQITKFNFTLSEDKTDRTQDYLLAFQTHPFLKHYASCIKFERVQPDLPVYSIEIDLSRCAVLKGTGKVFAGDYAALIECYMKSRSIDRFEMVFPQGMYELPEFLEVYKTFVKNNKEYLSFASLVQAKNYVPDLVIEQGVSGPIQLYYRPDNRPVMLLVHPGISSINDATMLNKLLG